MKTDDENQRKRFTVTLGNGSAHVELGVVWRRRSRCSAQASRGRRPNAAAASAIGIRRITARSTSSSDHGDPMIPMIDVQPPIDLAIADAMRDAQPEIDRAVEEAMREVEHMRPEIDAAIAEGHA